MEKTNSGGKAKRAADHPRHGTERAETGFEGSSGKDLLCPAANADREKRIRVYANADPVVQGRHRGSKGIQDVSDRETKHENMG